MTIPPDAARLAAAARVSRVRYRIMALLVGMSFVNYLLRNNLSIAQPSIQSEFHFSNEDFGWILFGFNLGYTALQIPGGILGDRLGPRLSLALTAAAWGVFTIFTGLAPSLVIASGGAALWALAAVRFLLGIANAPLFPLVAATFEKWFPVANWALPNAVTNVGIAFAQAVLGPMVALLIAYFGWRASFYWLAPTGFLIAAWWWWYARDKPREHRAVSDAEILLIETGRSERTPVVTSGRFLALLKPDVLLLAASYFCMNCVFYMFAQWLYAYLVDQRGFTMLAGGWANAVPYVTGAVLAVIGGATCDALCRRIGPRWGCRLPGVVGLTLVGLFMLLGVQAAHPYAAVALLALCFGFTQFVDSAYWQATTYVGGEHTAAATGVLNTGGNLPGLLAPVVGYVIDHFGWTTALNGGAVFAFIGAGLWFLIRVRHSAAATPQGMGA